MNVRVPVIAAIAIVSSVVWVPEAPEAVAGTSVSRGVVITPFAAADGTPSLRFEFTGEPVSLDHWSKIGEAFLGHAIVSPPRLRGIEIRVNEGKTEVARADFAALFQQTLGLCGVAAYPVGDLLCIDRIPGVIETAAGQSDQPTWRHPVVRVGDLDAWRGSAALISVWLPLDEAKQSVDPLESGVMVREIVGLPRFVEIHGAATAVIEAVERVGSAVTPRHEPDQQKAEGASDAEADEKRVQFDEIGGTYLSDVALAFEVFVGAPARVSPGYGDRAERTRIRAMGVLVVPAGAERAFLESVLRCHDWRVWRDGEDHVIAPRDADLYGVVEPPEFVAPADLDQWRGRFAPVKVILPCGPLPVPLVEELAKRLTSEAWMSVQAQAATGTVTVVTDGHVAWHLRELIEDLAKQHASR